MKPALLSATAAIAGESIAHDAIDKIEGGCSDPDLLLRMLTGLLAEQGHVVLPGEMLRSAVRVLQKQVEKGVGDATTA